MEIFEFDDPIERTIAWFSCGASSAVAAKMAVDATRKTCKPVIVAYTKIIEEHTDNLRFLRDCQEWCGCDIEVLINEKYRGSIYNVFE